MTSTAYPTVPYYEYLKQLPLIQKRHAYNTSQITYESLKANILAVSVYYDSLKYTHIKEQEQTSLIDLGKHLQIIKKLDLDQKNDFFLILSKHNWWHSWPFHW